MKTVFVVGGSSGIGRAVCSAAGASNWNVFVGYKTSSESAQAIVDEIKSAGQSAWPIQIDLCDEASIDGAVASIRKETAGLDAVVLSASPPPELVSFPKTTREMLENQFAVNVVGPLRLLSGLMRSYFTKQKQGHVVALLTAALQDPCKPHMTSYLIAKRAMQQMLECALAEYATSGLRCSSVSPDYTDTPMLKTFHSHVLEAARSQQVDGKFLDAAYVAEVVLEALNHPPASASLRSHRVTKQSQPV